jgi:hypothetical protein
MEIQHRNPHILIILIDVKRQTHHCHPTGEHIENFDAEGIQEASSKDNAILLCGHEFFSIFRYASSIQLLREY